MQTAEESLSKAARSLVESEAVLASIRASIERCEKLPTISTNALLNLPVKVGRTVE